MRVLQFSGGLDSLACLELLKDLPGLVVATVVTDGAYPEKEAYLSKVAQHYQNLRFFVLRSERALETFGQPVDVVPLRYASLGALVYQGPLKYQPFTDCCRRGFWAPLQAFMQQIEATEIYRGQRADDVMKAPIADGYELDGVTYRFPIENWTRAQVMAYVHEKIPELVPEYYATEKTSRDCWDCTAYLFENHDRIRNLPTEQRVKVSKILDEWRRDVNEETRW